MPDIRYNEVASFVKGGLRDLSVSRTTFTWGIPVPGNAKHVVYVWFDALTNYLTGIGFLSDPDLFEQFWPCDAHLIGKDILRFHAVYWPSFLMSAGIELPRHVFAHGWWTVEGQKMSKSLGNVVDPARVVKQYGADEFRFFLFREVPFGLDGDFSKDAIKGRINGDLANDFGNLVSRSANMIGKFLAGRVGKPAESGGTDAHLMERIEAHVDEYEKEMEVFSFYKALAQVFEITALLNKYIDTEAPWKLAKENPGRVPTVLYNVWNGVRIAALLLYPFMPDEDRPGVEGPRDRKGHRKGELRAGEAVLSRGRSGNDRENTADFPSNGVSGRRPGAFCGSLRHHRGRAVLTYTKSMLRAATPRFRVIHQKSPRPDPCPRCGGCGLRSFTNGRPRPRARRSLAKFAAQNTGLLPFT